MGLQAHICGIESAPGIPIVHRVRLLEDGRSGFGGAEVLDGGKGLVLEIGSSVEFTDGHGDGLLETENSVKLFKSGNGGEEHASTSPIEVA